MKHVRFPGRLVVLGFGSIGQGVLPLILRHIDIDPARITIVTAEPLGHDVAEKYGVRFIEQALTRENYRQVLSAELGSGDFLLNVSVDVSSTALVELCRELNALYLDTCTEPWKGGYLDPSLTPSQRSNYAFRETALALRQEGNRGPTALMTHGANPGLVSHLVKQALLNVAAEIGINAPKPANRSEWAALMERVGVKVIHIAERDTQTSKTPKQPDEFVNTWSIEGFYGEGCQPAELGWGSHERSLPADGRRHDFGPGCAIYLMRPGASVRVRTWTPQQGPFLGFMITHGESISIADYFTVGSNGHVRFRPTVHYAYHPCDDAVLSIHEMAGRNWTLQDKKRLLMKDVASGIDELGVLLMGHAKGIYWFGSRLSIEEARDLAPHNNATSLQVTASVLAGMVWAIENPERGILEPDEVDFERILELASPYLGNLVGAYSDWTPIQGRERLFPEDVDLSDPWQFKNFVVI